MFDNIFTLGQVFLVRQKALPPAITLCWFVDHFEMHGCHRMIFHSFTNLAHHLISRYRKI